MALCQSCNWPLDSAELKGGAKRTEKQNLERMAPWKPFLETLRQWFLRRSREGKPWGFLKDLIREIEKGGDKTYRGGGRKLFSVGVSPREVLPTPRFFCLLLSCSLGLIIVGKSLRFETADDCQRHRDQASPWIGCRHKRCKSQLTLQRDSSWIGFEIASDLGI